MSSEITGFSITDDAVSPETIKRQIDAVRKAMADCMKQGVHYDTIKGTDRPTLLKPGAELLNLMFRLRPTYEVEPVQHFRGMVHYVIRCSLTHIPTGELVATGMGSCSSHESKYRFRWIKSRGKPDRDTADRLVAQGLGKWRKLDDVWRWFERIENDNPMDLGNTILKMACKRAHIAATLGATATSEVFTQDLEELPQVGGEPEGGQEVDPQGQQASIESKSEENLRLFREDLKGAASLDDISHIMDKLESSQGGFTDEHFAAAKSDLNIREEEIRADGQPIPQQPIPAPLPAPAPESPPDIS